MHTAVIAELGRTEEIAPLYQAMPELIANRAVALMAGGVQTMAGVAAAAAGEWDAALTHLQTGIEEMDEMTCHPSTNNAPSLSSSTARPLLDVHGAGAAVGPGPDQRGLRSGFTASFPP